MSVSLNGLRASFCQFSFETTKDHGRQIIKSRYRCGFQISVADKLLNTLDGHADSAM